MEPGLVTRVQRPSGLEDVPCDNFAVCGAWLPSWWKGCKGVTVCTNCHIEFGKENVPLKQMCTECVICYEQRDCVAFPSCSIHFACVNCFRKRVGWSTRDDDDDAEESHHNSCPMCRAVWVPAWRNPSTKYYFVSFGSGRSTTR